MLKLYQFPPKFGLPNASPFCLKLETYLKMANIPYENVYVSNPGKSPKGKLPYIKDGKTAVGDSSLAIEYLKTKYGDKLDADLSHDQQMQCLALQRLIEEHLYWCALYSRWGDEQGWPILREAFFGSLPGFIKNYISKKIRKLLVSEIYNQGMGRHTQDEIYQFGMESLDYVAYVLGDKPYILGDQIHTIDAIVYAMTVNILYTPFESPLKEHARKFPSLDAHCRGVHERYFREYELE